MTDLRAVCSLFRERYGDAASDNDVKAFCFTAILEIEKLLRDGADRNDIRVLGAAAALANLRLNLRSVYSGDAVTCFKAGDVTVSMTPQAAAESAKSEYLQAIRELSPLMSDRDFSFKQVKIS